MKHKETACKTESAYLNRLGKILLRYFPAGQVREILEDYQEHFSLGRERGGTDGEFISALGTPETVTAEILKEMPEGRPYYVRHTACWGFLTLFNCFWLVLRYTEQGWSFYRNTARDIGSCVLMVLSAVCLFILLRGREQAAVESRSPQTSLRPGAVLYLFPLVLVTVLEILFQFLFTAADRGALVNAPPSLGPLCNAVLTFCQFLIALLIVWSLRRACNVSIRYFPAAVSGAGALLTIRGIQEFLRGMDISAVDWDARQVLLSSLLLVYGTGLVLALLFWCCIRWKSRERS